MVQESGRWLCKTTELVELLEISEMTLTNWKRQGLKQEKRGLWDLKHVLKWRGMIYNQNTEETQTVDLQQRKLEVEICLKEAQTELTALKKNITGGKYLEREVVVEDYRRFFVSLKSFALSLPRRLSLTLSKHLDPLEAKKIEKELNTQVKKMLNDFYWLGVADSEKV